MNNPFHTSEAQVCHACPTHVVVALCPKLPLHWLFLSVQLAFKKQDNKQLQEALSKQAENTEHCCIFIISRSSSVSIGNTVIQTT